MWVAILGDSHPMRISSHVNTSSVEMHFFKQSPLSVALTCGFL